MMLLLDTNVALWADNVEATILRSWLDNHVLPAFSDRLWGQTPCLFRIGGELFRKTTDEILRRVAWPLK